METKNTNLATKAFWIDLGNVLFFFDYGIFLDKIKDSLTMAPSQVKELIYTSEFVAQFERGLIDEEAFFKEFTAHTGLRMHKDYFFQAFADIFWENTPFIKFIKDQLKPITGSFWCPTSIKCIISFLPSSIRRYLSCLIIIYCHIKSTS